MSKIIEYLKVISMIPGISGNENYSGISKKIFSIAKEINSNTKLDNFGNVISIVGDGDVTIIIDAHLDEVGFIVSGIRNRYAELLPIGDINMGVIDNSQALVLHGETKGFIRKYSGGIVFDMSGSNTVDSVKSGALVSFSRSCEYDSASKIIRATALDNRIGCTCLLEIMRNIAPAWNKGVRIVFAFTAGEEKNNSILDKIALEHRADFGIVVDAAYATPVSFDVKNMVIPELGDGCAIQYVGNGFVVNKNITNIIEKEALKRKISFQSEMPTPNIGRTNFPKLHEAGVPGCVLNIPVRNQHCQVSEANIKDVNSTIHMIKMVIELFDKDRKTTLLNQ